MGTSGEADHCQRQARGDNGARGDGRAREEKILSPLGSGSLPSEIAGMASEIARANLCKVCWIQFFEIFLFFELAKLG